MPLSPPFCMQETADCNFYDLYKLILSIPDTIQVKTYHNMVHYHYPSLWYNFNVTNYSVALVI